MEFTPLKHIIFVPGPACGHLRPGLKTTLRMVEKFPNLFISVFVYPTEAPKAIGYLGAQTHSYSNRIKIVTASRKEVPPPVNAGGPVNMLAYMEESFRLWVATELCFTGHAELCHGTGILERLAQYQAGAHGEENLDAGASEVYLQVFKALHIENDEEDDNFYLLPQNVSNRFIRIPGLPAIHEWELNPQYLPFIPAFLGFEIPRIKNIIKQVDIIVFGTTFEMEPISASSLLTAFDVHLTPFFIGPSVDLVSTHRVNPNSPVTRFLDRTYTEKGAHSVIYIAFGTAFFPLPSSMSRLMAAVEEVPKAGLRFIFALSSAKAKVDQSWMDAHIERGNAIFPEWTNQTAVLEHPAIHYFLSHGGWNSSTEALVRGVPMIFWPFIGDQPTNAMQIATVHDCGFELLQVWIGPAKSTAYQNGAEVKVVGTDNAVRGEMKRILELSKEPRGEHQRTNVRMMGKVVTESLALGESGDLGLDKFGKALSLA
ncbi:unnamed protein product [Rhizoctonia solani]|uniref:UDP-glycosyltransferase 74C1 n=1 Tax=Rhizoctonia solani TaxID=456999 RepID=A0A8H3ARM4_9AGAM|nr:unnamed protein product [Rhizoctonia solani]